MVTAARLRALAMALPDTTEVPHMERTAYRTPRKIFATVPPDGLTANLLLVPELQAAPHAPRCSTPAVVKACGTR